MIVVVAEMHTFGKVVRVQPHTRVRLVEHRKLLLDDFRLQQHGLEKQARIAGLRRRGDDRPYVSLFTCRLLLDCQRINLHYKHEYYS
jgi:hypothetical protein